MATEEVSEDARSILTQAASSLPPLHAVADLLSVGVCVQCIFRLFGVRGQACYCPSVAKSVLHSFLDDQKIHQNSSLTNGSCPFSSKNSYNGETCCCVCLGILELTCLQDQETTAVCKDGSSIDDFTSMISDKVKRENLQVDGFSLEISLPPVIAANERAIWLYVKRKFGGEQWFNDKVFSDHMSIRDFLRLLLTTSLENHMNVKAGSSSFNICLKYLHCDASRKLQYCLSNGRCQKRIEKVAAVDGNSSEEYTSGMIKDGDKHRRSESDAFIYRTLDSMPDHDFIELFQIPPEKASKPCHLTTTCYRMPIYIGGRYLKFSRNVSQSRWIIDDERMGEASVEEIIGENVQFICRGDYYKFHAAGREDIDVRMLGSGRPFLVEVSNARCMPSTFDILQIAEKTNNSDKKYVGVRNLKVVGAEAWNMMREGEAEKQKQYAALIWFSRPLVDSDLQIISSMKDMEIVQKTPIRVLHRRSPLERKRIIHWMVIEKVEGSSQYFLLHLCTQAGTYIKEFVHGDFGRTHPSIGSIFGCRTEILQLDVTNVKMDFLG